MALFQSKKIRQLEQQVKALQSYNNSQLFYLNGQSSLNYYPDWSINETTNKYATSDQVYSVVNKIAETSAFIPIYPYLKTEDKALKQLKTLTNRQFYSTKGLFDIRIAQTKALEDLPEDNELNLLLETPNEYQSKTEFLTAAYSYYLLNGEVFIYKDRISEAANTGKVKWLHIFPASCVTLHITGSFPFLITAYDFVINGRPVLENIPVEDIIHWKRFNPNYSINGDHLDRKSVV